jgi:hypothetical protein
MSGGLRRENGPASSRKQDRRISRRSIPVRRRRAHAGPHRARRSLARARGMARRSEAGPAPLVGVARRTGRRPMSHRSGSRRGKRGCVVQAFCVAVVARFPGCPAGEARRIARFACLRDSGRVGDLASGLGWSEQVIELAVIAHIRHRLTDYERLLDRGHGRGEARELTQGDVSGWLERWSHARRSSDPSGEATGEAPRSDSVGSAPSFAATSEGSSPNSPRG